VIDYIFVSNVLYSSICNVTAQARGVNFSYHVPVIANFTTCIEKRNVASNYKNNSESNTVRNLRWDKADLGKYYECTYMHLLPVYNELLHINELEDIVNYFDVINDMYRKKIAALISSDVIIPRANCNVFKHWWNQSLDEYKMRSIEGHGVWVAAGKPREGEFYQRMVKVKYEYKEEIRKYREASEQGFSDNLSEALMGKDADSFWKTWNRKFKNKSLHANIVEGCNDCSGIANVFKNSFSRSSEPNNVAIHREHKIEFWEKFKMQYAHENELILFSVCDIEHSISKLKRGKSAGQDNVTAEHLIFAHPCLCAALKLLFNLMLKYGFVPDDFGKGILIPLLKGSGVDASLVENYRGITISCMVSKIFEYAILAKFNHLFETDSLQFGFRHGVGCSDALFTVKSVINHYTKNGCTVNVAALDISKAFDRISYYALFSKLLKRNFPSQLINIFISWYSKSYVKVKWKDKLSESFQVSAGVRQGGVLSPFLFAIYIEDIVSELKREKKGCIVNGVYLGCFLYADDILLLSQSVSCMQIMLNICTKQSKCLDLKFNVVKSVVMRIGNRFNIKCCDVILDGQILPYAEEIKYLGIFIKKGRFFDRSLTSMKIKFYRCFNAIYSKSSYASEEVIISLFKSYCLPIVTYACEAVPPNRADIRSLNKLISIAFYKIFHTYDTDVINAARVNFGVGDIADILSDRHNRFLNRYYCKNFPFASVVRNLNSSHIV